MAEEKKEIESSVEDKKVLDSKTEGGENEEKKLEEDKSQEKDGFVKDGENVSANKYNQALRKAREAELDKIELAKKLADTGKDKAEKKEEKSEDDEEEDEDFFGKENKEEKKEIPDPNKLIDERLKPVLEKLDKREADDRKNARTAFFEAHPKYLTDAVAWQGLLDEMGNSINPNSKDDYYTQLEKTHRILAGDNTDVAIEDKKAEIASDSSGDGAEKGSAKEEFNAEDRKLMKDHNISEEGMRVFKKQLAEGKTSVL